MNGQEFKTIRLKLKLSASALGRALGYEGPDANVARTIYRLEAGRPIPRPVGRLMEMFDAFGVPRAWAGETAQRKHAAMPRWSTGRPPSASYDGGFLQKTTAKMLEARAHGPEAISDMANRPAETAQSPPAPTVEHGLNAISTMAKGPSSRRRMHVPLSPAASVRRRIEPKREAVSSRPRSEQ